MKKHVSVEQWVAMFEEVGLDKPKRAKWHKLFESRHPEAHQGFLEWLGLPPKDIDQIRSQSR